jgi:endonuclease YncB( thermonuclease family)
MPLASAWAFAFVILAVTAAAAEELKAIPRIVDADTVYLGTIKVRLSGIDAPETDQLCLDSNGRQWSCGVAARDNLQVHSAGRLWSCKLTGLDRYGRSLGSCSIEGEDVSRRLVRSGFALAFRRYSMAYVQDEEFARARKAGLWSGAFISPWDWRHRNWQTEILGAVRVPTDAQRILISPLSTATPPNPICNIKGNLGRSDQCIYHVPGQRYYDQLKMETSGTRRWFCSEEEAQAAGCRRSKL